MCFYRCFVKAFICGFLQFLFTYANVTRFVLVSRSKSNVVFGVKGVKLKTKNNYSLTN